MMRLRATWEYVRGTYWAVPSAMSVAASLLSIGVIHLDEAVGSRLSWVYAGGPEGARAVLSTIAGSMITVAGVTFSITIVALTLASQQFGPRLLRNFLRDLGNQIVLGTFVSTFLYCLLVLRTIRGTEDVEFVPHLAVTIGVGLAMVSLGVLIFFIHHVVTSIQASRIIARVAADLDAAANRLFPEAVAPSTTGGAADASTTPRPTAGALTVVRAALAGYVQAIDDDRLVAVARGRDLRVWLHVAPGAFVRPGSALMTVCAETAPDDWASDVFRGLVMIGAEHSGTQDIRFFMGQLVELAVRALSPGINDPATARGCLDRLEHALSVLASRRLPDAVRLDADRVPRVMAQPVTFATFVDTAFAEVGRHAESSVSVTCRLLDAVRNVAHCVQRDGDRAPLLEQALAIRERSRQQRLAPGDRARIEDAYAAARDALGPGPGSRVAWPSP